MTGAAWQLGAESSCQQREELESGAFQYSNVASELPTLLAAESQAD